MILSVLELDPIFIIPMLKLWPHFLVLKPFVTKPIISQFSQLPFSHEGSLSPFVQSLVAKIPILKYAAVFKLFAIGARIRTNQTVW